MQLWFRCDTNESDHSFFPSSSSSLLVNWFTLMQIWSQKSFPHHKPPHQNKYNIFLALVARQPMCLSEWNGNNHIYPSMQFNVAIPMKGHTWFNRSLCTVHSALPPRLYSNTYLKLLWLETKEFICKVHSQWRKHILGLDFEHYTCQSRLSSD